MAKKKRTPTATSGPLPTTPPTVPPQGTLTEKQSKGSEACEVPWCDGPAEYTAAQANSKAADNTAPQAQSKDQGDTLPAPIATDGNLAAARTRDDVRDRKHEVTTRLHREGRWNAAAETREALFEAGRKKGMLREDLHEWVYSELDRLYPPLKPKDSPVETASEPIESPAAADLPGLYSIPAEWPALPDNASLQQELGWVQSQRLAVVEERGNAVVVRLERASSPAPSKAALGWLETSIRSYAKYIEVAAKTLAGAADEAEATRRERMRLEEIRALLDEMHRDAV